MSGQTAPDGQVEVELTVNGNAHHLEVDPRLALVDLLRDELGLTGTHVGCRSGDCGSCTVSMDGRIVKSCLILAASADGAALRTIEGLAENGQLSPVQRAFWDEYGFQCGYCLPGMLFAADDLLEQNPAPDEADIRRAVDGNLCRCTGYHGIVRAVRMAAGGRSGDDESVAVADEVTPGLGTNEATTSS